MAARLTAYLVVAIVGATFIAGLSVGAQRDDNEGPVDLIVQNATVFTADPRGTMAEAVAVRGNRILRVGTTREIARLQRRQTVVVDARGGAVLPGFNDAHLRFSRGALTTRSVDLAGATTVSEVLARVSGWNVMHPGSRMAPDATWVVGRGWAPEHFRSATPWRQVLDSVAGTRPVVLFGTDGSTAWASTAALQRAGITRGTPDPVGGAIARETRSGEPSGLLRGTASDLVVGHIPAPSREERLEALRRAIAEANAAGITSAQSIDDTPAALEDYGLLRRKGDLTLRIYSAVAVQQPLTEDALRRLDETKRQYADDPLLKAGAISLRLDGAVSTRSAALLTPYAGAPEGTPSTGETLFTPDALNRTVRLADAAGWQVVTHASGDRSVRMALDAYAHALRSNPLPERGRRHRIGSMTVVDPADLPRFGTLGVIASTQPARAFLTTTGIDLVARQIGSARSGRIYPLRALAAETRLVFGSGWPDEDMNPLAGLHAVVTRAPATGRQAPRWDVDQSLGLKRAIEAYTSQAAWASFDDQRKGSIVAGMLADLVVLSEDIFDAPPNLLAETTVAYTIFDGNVVYKRPAVPETD
jgi:predicted amidohydrolase YtcJ